MSYLAYLKLEGIVGECSDEGHAGWMPLESFNQNLSGPHEQGGRTSMTDLALTRLADQATPQLARATAEGRHFKEAILELCIPDGAKTKYMEIRLTNVRITNYGISGAPQNDSRTPYENLMLSFQKIEWLYFPDAFGAAPGKAERISRAAWAIDGRPVA